MTVNHGGNETHLSGGYCDNFHSSCTIFRDYTQQVVLNAMSSPKSLLHCMLAYAQVPGQLPVWRCRMAVARGYPARMFLPLDLLHLHYENLV